MPMTRRVAALYLIAFLIGAGLFAANFFTERSFLLPLVLAIVMTAAHLGVGAWWIAQKPRRAAGITAGVLALLAGASWATWVAAAWEEFQAQASLPIINVAGLPAFALSPVVLICVAVAAMQNRAR
ncbi:MULTISPECIES: MFS transporter [Corynebacterium]|uniref:MFS transporter n=1 Tax=Corynebacterium TaxID=1716 RepID=UPI0016423FA5|nr:MULTISPECIES: MFS transporter [Corynebacterium]MCQ9676800.1 MFS transporter [Corynebacterium sp. BF-R-2]